MSLKRPRLPVTGLPEALADQPSRLWGGGGGPIVAAADTVLGTPVVRDEAVISPWHGYFLLDARATARLGEHVDLTASAAAWQVSASSGYRALAAVKPGLTAHVYGDLVSLGAHPLHAELVTVDLGETTVGRGLLLERQLVEGAQGGLRWGAWHLGALVGGQTTYPDDDLSVTRLGFGVWAELNWVRWQTGGRRQTHYLTLAGGVPALGEG